jgi:hypothetical protein
MLSNFPIDTVESILRQGVSEHRNSYEFDDGGQKEL